MFIIPYIIPALLCLCTILLIWAAEAAHRPYRGTTEWIHRAAFPARMSPGAETASAPAGIDALPAAIVTLIYFGLIYLSLGGVDFKNPVSVMTFVCAGLTMPVNYFIAKLLTGKLNSSLFAAVLCLSDAWYLSGASLGKAAGLFAVTLYILFLLIYVNRPFYIIPGGLFLGCAVFFVNGNVIFALLGVIISIVLSVLQNSAKPFVMNLIFGAAVPAIVYCVPTYILQGKLTFSLGLAASGVPLTTVCLAVMFIAAAVHIFRDKSFFALFASLGFLINAAALFMSAVPVPVLTALPAVFLGNIVFSRGRAAGKTAVWIFAGITLLCLAGNILAVLLSHNSAITGLTKYLFIV